MYKQTILALTFAIATLAPQFANAQGAAPAPAADFKKAEDVYKNITEMKGTPADQLTSAMQFISASLGVDCEFCHVQGKPEADDKNAKKTTRQMMQLTAMINKDGFRGQRQITCYSCHRGAERPVAAPPVQDSDTPAKPVTSMTMVPRPQGTTAPTADAIIEKYVAALGGADNIKKITTHVMKGSIMVGGTENPIELITKAPNKRLSISHNGGFDSYTVFDGTNGWTGNLTNQRDMSPSDAASASLDAEFALALRVKEVLTNVRGNGRATVQINGVECEQLSGTGPGRMPVSLYFDSKTGLLVRMTRSTDTPMGRMPVQIDYADYREQNGVKTPFRWTLSRPNGRFTIQIKEMQNNTPVDDSKFAKPAAK